MSDIKEELELPKNLDLSNYKFTNLYIYNVKLDEEYKSIHGFYVYDDYENMGNIYLADLPKSKVHQTFLHEYSHHLITMNKDNLPYIKKLKQKKMERATDVLAYYLSKDKNIKFRPNYLTRLEIKYMYKTNEKLRKDIDKLVELETSK